jgi:PAS domain-containing protein
MRRDPPGRLGRRRFPSVPDARVDLGVPRQEALRRRLLREHRPASRRRVFVVDPMLATGGSSVQAIGGSSAPARDRSRSSALRRARRCDALHAAHPEVRSSPPRSTASSTATATSAGVGDAGDRIFGTDREDERRYRVLVDANVVGVTVSDHERVLEANDAWLRITGHTRAEQEAGS